MPHKKAYIKKKKTGQKVLTFAFFSFIRWEWHNAETNIFFFFAGGFQAGNGDSGSDATNAAI